MWLTFESDNVYIVGMAALLGTFEQIVLLAVVAAGDQAYGRAVLRAVEANLAGDRSVSAGSVYATLDRLEAQCLVASRLERGTPARRGRARRFYRLTPEGARALTEARNSLEKMWRGVRWPMEVMV
jgi:DNA-binding PadR family transcriptional regulator